MPYARVFITGITVFFLLYARPAFTQGPAPPGNVCSIQFENDFFGGGTDRHFTHGSRIGCLTRPTEWMADAAGTLPWFSPERALQDPAPVLEARGSISVGQNIYTPEDITRTDLIGEDRPYAGWLYMGMGLVANQGGRRYDKIELTFGVVGPLSIAREVQEEWHARFDLREPRGWDHQLKNEMAVNLFYEQARRMGSRDLFYGLGYDIIPHFGGGIGNVFTFVSAGLTVRVGPDLEEDFGPPRMRPSLPGGGYFRSREGFNWYLFAGAEGRAVAHNIFLDGNTFAHSHSVDKRPLVGDLQAGIAVQVSRFRIAYTQIMRTREYRGQDRPDEFGALSISYQF